MHGQNINKIKIISTGIVTVFTFSILFWEHLHGGVASHHILHQKELPAISNWWSGLLLPVFTWILLGRIENRLTKQWSPARPPDQLLGKILGRFMAGLVFAVFIAVSFTHTYTAFLDNVMYIFLIVSLIIPIYYAEFILGFVLGMTYTFGAILPTVFILLLAAIGFLIYRFIRPILIKLPKTIGITPTRSPDA